MKILRHIIIVSGAVFLALGVPFLSTDYFSALVNGSETDAVSGASMAVDQPSGNYIVLINREKHTDAENLELWHDFFGGEEISYIFEDIKCTAAQGDAGGIQMAESYRSRLPENQMELKKEDATLMLSKAEHGKFDIIVMSEEIADFYKASTVYDNDNVDVINVKGVTE